jgi:hypothetical protein
MLWRLVTMAGRGSRPLPLARKNVQPDACGVLGVGEPRVND